MRLRQRGATTKAPATTGAAPAAASASAAASANPHCGTLLADVRRAVTRPSVTTVELVADCGSVEITTSLTKAGTGPGDAQAICAAAATVAYPGAAKNITITAADSTELAIGIAGQSCVGEP